MGTMAKLSNGNFIVASSVNRLEAITNDASTTPAERADAAAAPVAVCIHHTTLNFVKCNVMDCHIIQEQSQS